MTATVATAEEHAQCSIRARTQVARVAADASEHGHDSGQRQAEAAKAQGDDHDVPQRTPIVEKREVEAVQAVI